MQVRAATPEDIPDMLRIEQESETAAHWSADAYSRLFAAGAPPGKVLVAEEDQKLAGFIVARGLDGEWEIENLVVAAEHRRSGIASELVRELLRDLESAGAETVLLEVRESNLAARRLYEKAGFSEQGRRREYYRNPVEDALVLRYVLRLCNNIS